MSSAEFLEGLNAFSKRHAVVQRELAEIERIAFRFRDMERYRALLDELVVIGMERARFCAHWNKHASVIELQQASA